jgi:hypothetical protein
MHLSACARRRFAMSDPEKRYRVEITKPDGTRKVEFSRYAKRADAELAAKALRRHGIDARAMGNDEAQLEQAHAR